MLFSELIKHIPNSTEKFSATKAKLLELTNEYSSLLVERDFLAWQGIHFHTIKSLKSRNDVYLTKPDKGAGVVTLNKQDYLDKMNDILNDSTKFRMIGPADTRDNTSKVEARTQIYIKLILSPRKFTTG